MGVGMTMRMGMAVGMFMLMGALAR
jgi:hypothetical protein